jgi:O-acetyl-ADP-ribose deacetylase (regulator of RNase III)
MVYGHSNREGSRQSVANDSSHTHQAEGYSLQSESLYWHMCNFKHIENIPGVELPDAKKFTLYDRCKDANLRLLQSEYPLPASQTLHYKLIVGDLLTFREAQVIGHQADCTSLHAQGLAALIATQLGSNSHANRIADSRNPFLARVSSQPTPGTISVERGKISGGWIAHLYAQKDCCLPHRKEDASMRMMWFKGCLVLLGNYVREHGLNGVALPFGIGCSIARGEWNRYSNAINQWAEENADAFAVYVITKAY